MTWKEFQIQKNKYSKNSNKESCYICDLNEQSEMLIKFSWVKTTVDKIFIDSVVADSKGDIKIKICTNCVLYFVIADPDERTMQKNNRIRMIDEFIKSKEFE